MVDLGHVWLPQRTISLLSQCVCVSCVIRTHVRPYQLMVYRGLSGRSSRTWRTVRSEREEQQAERPLRCSGALQAYAGRGVCQPTLSISSLRGSDCTRTRARVHAGVVRAAGKARGTREHLLHCVVATLSLVEAWMAYSDPGLQLVPDVGKSPAGAHTSSFFFTRKAAAIVYSRSATRTVRTSTAKMGRRFLLPRARALSGMRPR